MTEVGPELEANFAQLAGENPVLAYMRRTRDGRPYRISDFLSRDEYHRLPLYRGFYRHVGVEYQVAMSLPSRPPVVIGLAMIRAAGDFTDPEVALLGAARPHLIQAYRNAELAAAREATIAALEARLEEVGTSVIVVDRYGRVDMATPSGRRLLAGRLGGTAGRLAPDLIEALAARRAAGTPATEALRWVALGRRGPEVARLLGISPRTVENHLQAAYAKLGVSGASEAAATAWAAVGVRYPGPA